ncbi:MAG: hypothetical protein HC911_16015 [Chloroflexaceae bacterium]|nr:hypothetical protein [Chloroflexaceae bacterium]
MDGADSRQHQYRGSQLRCLLLTDGPRDVVAQRLSALAAPMATVDAAQHHWLPRGLHAPQEAQLDKTPELLSPELCEQISSWWLAVPKDARTPTWDIAATATVDGRPGLLLVEAKAHSAELSSAGKHRDPQASTNSQRNDKQITTCLREASTALNALHHGWQLSTASHYQLANRFAWSWKLASLGVPVVLVYLGFLQAAEMTDRGMPFADAAAWEQTIRQYSRGSAPEHIWNTRLLVGDVPMYACIQSLYVPVPA